MVSVIPNRAHSVSDLRWKPVKIHHGDIWCSAGYSSRPIILLYVNDLPANLQSSVRLFADEALLYGITSNEDDCNRLQADLFELECWQDRWQMRFNPS